MSRTEYAWGKILRIDEPDRVTLYRAVMRSIELISRGECEPFEPPSEEVRSQELARLRSLLDRLEDL